MMTKRKPNCRTYKKLHVAELDSRIDAWGSKRLVVCSSIHHRADGFFDWHVSVSVRGIKRRASDLELRKVRQAFGMMAAEEDNHEPGLARHLFLAVEPERRKECECKTTEETVVESDGHRWQVPPDQRDVKKEVFDAFRKGVGAKF